VPTPAVREDAPTTRTAAIVTAIPAVRLMKRWVETTIPPFPVTSGKAAVSSVRVSGRHKQVVW
jgi:hypothetical protein